MTDYRLLVNGILYVGWMAYRKAEIYIKTKSDVIHKIII